MLPPAHHCNTAMLWAATSLDACSGVGDMDIGRHYSVCWHGSTNDVQGKADILARSPQASHGTACRADTTDCCSKHWSDTFDDPCSAAWKQAMALSRGPSACANLVQTPPRTSKMSPQDPTRAASPLTRARLCPRAPPACQETLARHGQSLRDGSPVRSPVY